MPGAHALSTQGLRAISTRPAGWATGTADTRCWHRFDKDNTMVTKKPKGLGRGLEALLGPKVHDKEEGGGPVAETGLPSILQLDVMVPGQYQDRKSTRLNSSHLVISYAVFCLKKK